MKYAPYSFSKIDKFITCPRKFDYNYINKAPKKPQNMEPLLKGGAVHSILENFPTASAHKLAPKYQHIADKFIGTNLGQHLLFRESTREHDLGLTKTLEPCAYNDKTALFRGSVDYIFMKDDALHLIDWKTGKFKEQRWQSYDQLKFYAIYFFQKYPKVNKINVSYVYIEHENMQNDLLLTREHLDTYKIDLLTKIAAIEVEAEFAKTTTNTKLCDWCEFQEHCDQN